MADIADRLNQSVLSVEQRRRNDGSAATVVVLDDRPPGTSDERQLLTDAADRSGLAAVEFVDRSTWDAIRRLAEAGIIRLGDAAEVLHRSPALDDLPAAAARASVLRRSRIASDWLDQSERKLRMAALLADGGFAVEALPAVGDAACMALRGLAIVADPGLDSAVVETLPRPNWPNWKLFARTFPAGAVAWLASNGPAGAADLEASRAAAQNLLASARGAIVQT